MKRLHFVLAFLSLFIISCSKNGGGSGNASSGRLEVRITDSPTGIDAVNIDLKGLDVSTSDDPATTNWTALTMISTGVINLLSYTNGNSLKISDLNVTPSVIKQLRLRFGTNNSVVVNGTTYPLTLAPAAQNGTVIPVTVTITANGNASAWIDFIAARSITQTAPNTFILNPFLRAFNANSSGGVEGYVLPAVAQPVIEVPVYNSNGIDTTILVAIPDANGYFKVVGLSPAQSFPGGSTGQAIIYQPLNSTYLSTSKIITIVTGTVNNLGTTTLFQ
ncbi:MAG: DUF4382 domain-containing protein [Chitinophagaceae bacterium]|nr:MAG: DUF4382 domain-containing protein [Chitinophagaceae bacterium]